MKWFFHSIGVALLVVPQVVFAAVVVNEIAWMGNANSASDEWIELRNTSSTDVDLTGWTLSAIDETPSIVLSGSIRANGYFLLERTNDDSVVGVAADQVYVGALGNSGEKLFLIDSNGSAMDTVDASGGWPAGDNDTKHTMQRVDNSWITASPTPKTENVFLAVPPPAPAPQVVSPSPVPAPQPTSPSPTPILEPLPVPIAQPASIVPSTPAQVAVVEDVKLVEPVAASNVVNQVQQGVATNNNQQKKIVVAPSKVREEENKKVLNNNSETQDARVLKADVSTAKVDASLYWWFFASIVVGLGAGLLGVKIKNHYTHGKV